MDDEIYGKRVMKVYCFECSDLHTTEEVKFLNIEEDFQGRDLMTFECPETNTEQKSNVYG
jgi:hypothetical protein